MNAGLQHNNSPGGTSCCQQLACPPQRTGRDLTWVDLVGFYPAPQECLAAFLVSSAAEVLAGVKPANLIRMVKRTLPCGRAMYPLWQEYGAALLKKSALAALPLRDDNDGLLLLLYRPDLLQARLSGRTMQAFLERCGYPRPLTVQSSLLHLQQRFQVSGSPDEVGFFLGYPAKDIKGFIDGREKPWQGRCLWRVYGPPRRSLDLYRRFCRERSNVTARLVSGCCPRDLLVAA